MKSFTSIAVSSALLFSGIISAQGCASLEPNNPYCQLPLYSDYEVNATFDDLAVNSVPSDYQGVAWSGFTVATNTTQQQLVPASIKNYANANIGTALLSTTTDYIYLIGLSFGCSAAISSTNPASYRPTACTLQVQGTCIPEGFSGWEGPDLVTLNWTFKYTPRIVGTAANLTYASPYQAKTTYNGTSKTHRPVLCTNYTLSATNANKKPVSLYVDNANLAIYTAQYL